MPGPEDDRQAPPRRKTDYCLNVGITWSGLVALEVKDRLPGFSHGTFNAFVEGAAQRAEALGDRGASGPEHWISGFGTGNDHVLVTLYALHPEAMEHYSTRLLALFAEGRPTSSLHSNRSGGTGYATSRKLFLGLDVTRQE